MLAFDGQERNTIVAEGFTALFERAQTGDGFAQETIYKLAFFRLRAIASALLRWERPAHTLQPTALVSELFLKLHRLETRVLSEDHFFRISARAMRQVLIDRARSPKPIKVSVEMVQEVLLLNVTKAAQPELSLAAKIVFERLRAMDATVAHTVWMRAVDGLTIRELSELQHREAWRVRADYDFGLQWMANQLNRCA
jgi:RNA polymerase sigma-70 factor (ECF subfamily)